MGASHRTTKGAHFSEGSRLLWMAVEASGLNLSKAAGEARCDRANFVKYIYGDRSPGRVDSIAILERFGVPLLSWDQEPTEPFVLPALRPKIPDSTDDLGASDSGAFSVDGISGSNDSSKSNGTEG